MEPTQELKKPVNRKPIIITAAIAAVVCIAIVVAIFAQGESTKKRLAEQLDLVERYLSELDYEQAIAAYEAAIEIDPKCEEAYLGLADAYIGLRDYESALEALEAGVEETDSEMLTEYLAEVNAEYSQIEAARLAEEEAVGKAGEEASVEEEENTFYPMIRDLNIPFTVDDIVLGETGIDVAKSSYANRPYVMSNLMNDEKADTVYTCFGMNETPIPEGYEKNEFGFLFAELVNGGGIYQIVIQDSSFTCIGGLCVGDSGDVALEYFGLQEIVFLEDTDLEWILDNGAALSYHKDNEEEYFISYEMDKNRVTVKVVDGVIHYISLLRESDLYE